MLILITGGSKCGKSGIAENLLKKFRKNKFYIASMIPYGDEAYKAIENHKKMRQGKGFQTIEKYTDIQDTEIPENSAVLLECMGNLCANEMFSGDSIFNPVNKIISGVRKIYDNCNMLVIVSNNVGNDGIEYDSGTSDYIRYLSQINMCIADFADIVIECIYGIPVILKGDISCLNL